MKSKTQINKEPSKSVSNTGKQVLQSPPENKKPSPAKEGDDDLSKDEISNLEEALKTADPGEPVTLKEFKKMAKKWGAK